jgi:error-prone DNA polymerase
MRPGKLYDLVIQVAIVRPGLIRGHGSPYLRRRNGEEKVVYPSPARAICSNARWACRRFRNRR